MSLRNNAEPSYEVLLLHRHSSPRLKFVFLAVLSCLIFCPAAAYDPLDPNGNVSIRWDVMSWTTDGYMASVTITNLQLFRHFMSPGWTLGWRWAKKEIIWAMLGAQAVEQGDCSKFKLNIPHSCKRDPKVVDLLPNAPFNQQFTNCCKGGVLASWGQDPIASVAAFQISVGLSGTSNKTVKLPKNFTLLGPGPGYTCGPAKLVPSTHFLSPDGRRKAQALMTWNVTCTYSKFLASEKPSCCVSLSAFYSPKIVPCPGCACGCPTNNNSCILANSTLLKKEGINTPRKDNAPLLQCTKHMCPVRIHWHIKYNYELYWRVKIAITNFDFRRNYTQWTLVANHPNLNNVTQVFSFNYKSLSAYQDINDTGMFYGMKFYNDLLMEAGPSGNAQSEFLMEKDKNTFTLRHGWGFPRKIYFNGEECLLPPPDQYPFLPNSANVHYVAVSKVAAFALLIFLCIF
ncbi:hypothetical protein UlMin_008438 [Ulmus minor]